MFKCDQCLSAFNRKEIKNMFTTVHDSIVLSIHTYILVAGLTIIRRHLKFFHGMYL